MANIREIALGLTTVLQMTTEPEPLGVDLWGQSADDASGQNLTLGAHGDNGSYRPKRRH